MRVIPFPLGVYLLAWLGMMVLAIVNGIVRERWMAPRLSALAAHQCSTLLLLTMLSLFGHILFSRVPLDSAGQALAVGGCWLILTLAFECGVGRLIGKRSWRTLLEEYNLLSGRLWLLIPLWLLVFPMFIWLVD